MLSDFNDLPSLDRREVLLVRTELDRIFVTASYACELIRRRHLQSLFFLPGDRIRDVTPAPAHLLPPPARWWSLAYTTEAFRRGQAQHRWRAPDDVAGTQETPGVCPRRSTIDDVRASVTDEEPRSGDHHGGVVH